MPFIPSPYDFDFDPFLSLVAFVSSVVGSSVQVTHRRLEQDMRGREIVAIYVTGVFLCYFCYELGRYYGSASITGISSSIASYISIDFVLLVKGSVITILDGVSKGLPKILLDMIRLWVNGKK